MHGVTFNDIVSAVSALAALIAAFHAVRANSKATTINANVNGNIQTLLKLLQEASITVPHETASRVIAGPPAEIPADATLDERLALEWLRKVRGGG